MSEAPSIVGRCLCGSVAIELAEPGDAVEICQCTMCRRWGGAFYAGLAGKIVRIEGEDAVGIVRSSEWAERAFCSRCGSGLWFRFLPTGNRSFSAGLFDAAQGMPIEREIFADESACWSRLSGDHVKLGGREILAEAEAAGFRLK